MNKKINLAAKPGLLGPSYSPGIVGYLQQLQAGGRQSTGEFVWHTDDETDDFFLVLCGRLTIQAIATSN